MLGNLTPGPTIKAPDGKKVEPCGFWTSSNGDVYQNQMGKLVLVQQYDPKKGRTY